MKEKLAALGKKKLIAIGATIGVVLILIVVGVVIANTRPEEPEPTPSPAPTPTLAPTPAPTPEPTPELADIPINFAEWQAINPDVYAYIRVPNTNVDYPILQHATDNTYYLDYNIDGSKGYPGCIYTENINAKDFTDMHTVLYGHNMRNGTMFRTLHNFEDADFFNANRYFYIYLPNEILEYEIFAAYTFDNRHLLHSYALDQPGVFQEYINNIYLQKGNISATTQVTAADHIVTMETCTGNSSTRFLVQGVLRSRTPGVYKGTAEASGAAAEPQAQ